MIHLDIKIKLNNLVYSQLKFPQITELLIFTFLLCMLWPIENKVILSGWYIVSMILCLSRYLFTYYYTHHIASHKNLKQWTLILTLIALSSGFSWGLLGSILMPSVIYEQVMILFLIIGVVAVGNLFYYPVKNIFLIFLVPAYIPHIIWLFIQGHAYVQIGCMAIIYSLLMLVISNNSYKMVTNSIKLQYENIDLISSLTDAKKQLEYLNEKLAIEATHDPLTNLLNRKSLNINLNQLLDVTQRNKGLLAILFCDLDKFKKINDSYGHEVGDKLLIQVSKRMQSILGESDVIARLGGDEFIIILNHISSLSDVDVQANKIIQIIHEPMKIDKFEFQIGMSIGISIFPLDAQDDMTLLKYADDALYQAKSEGRNRFALYSKTLP
jgi:diguanylate cyclase (GGDEF)-like protein